MAGPWLAVALATGACTPFDSSSQRADRVEVTVTQTNGDNPDGWIYAFDRRSGQPDACVYVWQDARWELGEMTSPGAFTSITARGRIENGVLVGLPVDVLRDADNLYQAGHIDARLDGVPLPRR